VLAAEECKPIPNARTEFWLANPGGEYDDAHRATVFAGKRGEYRLESNVPVSYGGRPPHIHLRVRAPGYEELVTQHYPERETLNELVDEDVRHTKAWPAAPNTLTSRLKRLAPALRGIGIEYGEMRTGRMGSRLKTLTKKEPAKDRQYRKDRQPPEEILQNEQKQTDNADGPDNTYTKDRQYESFANSGLTDGSDGTDDDLRNDSKENSSWQSDPMRHYGQGGMA
jgi:hypothetical protein